jgi:hypothetical protein
LIGDGRLRGADEEAKGKDARVNARKMSLGLPAKSPSRIDSAGDNSLKRAPCRNATFPALVRSGQAD